MLAEAFLYPLDLLQLQLLLLLQTVLLQDHGEVAPLGRSPAHRLALLLLTLAALLQAQDGRKLVLEGLQPVLPYLLLQWLELSQFRQSLSEVELSLGRVGLERDHEAELLLVARAQHLLLLRLFEAEGKAVVGSHVFQFELEFLFQLAPAARPLVRLLDGLLLFPLHLQAVLLHLDGALLHPPLVLQVVPAVEHVRPLVLLALLELLSLLDRPGVDLVPRGQLVHLLFLLGGLILGLAWLFAKSAQVLPCWLFRCWLGGVFSFDLYFWVGIFWVGCFCVLRLQRLSLFVVVGSFMQLLVRVYFLGHRIGDFLILPRFVFQQSIVVDVDDFPLVLAEPLQGHFHFPVRSAVVHLEGKGLDVSQFVGQHCWFFGCDLREGQFGLVIPHPVDHPVSFVLDHAHVLALLDDALLLAPPLNRLAQPIQLILPLLHVADLADYHEQLLVAPRLVLVSDLPAADPFVVELELVAEHLELLLVLEEGVEEEFEVERGGVQFGPLGEDVLVGLAQLGQWLEGLHAIAIKIISRL